MDKVSSGWAGQAAALLICGGITLLAQPLLGVIDLANIVMLFLLAVVVVAARWGRGAATTASFASTALFDFFFVPPRFSFSVHNAQYLITFAVMLLVALLISHLTTGLRQSAIEAAQREAQTRALYALAQRLAGGLTVAQVVQEVRDFLHVQVQHDMQVLLPSAQEQLQPMPGETLHLDMATQVVLHSAYQQPQTVELDRNEPPLLLVPLLGATRPRGMLLVSAPHLQRPLVEAVASLLATALERLHFVEVAEQQRMQVVTERLRSSILAALSHDIRTPLTVLYGLADSLTLPQQGLSPAALETAATLREQALRLHHLVNNLLDMARLHAGLVQLRKEWQPLEEVIGASLKLSAASLQQHTLRLDLPDNFPLLEFDAVLLERVLCNLLENAARYAPVGSEIRLQATLEEGCACIGVCNAGEGFPPDKLTQVFEPFERASQQPGGSGMGLAICRAVVEAHGGHIKAENQPGGGACVRFTLPLGQPPEIATEELP